MYTVSQLGKGIQKAQVYMERNTTYIKTTQSLVLDEDNQEICKGFFFVDQQFKLVKDYVREKGVYKEKKDKNEGKQIIYQDMQEITYAVYYKQKTKKRPMILELYLPMAVEKTPTGKYAVNWRKINILPLMYKTLYLNLPLYEKRIQRLGYITKD